MCLSRKQAQDFLVCLTVNIYVMLHGLQQVHKNHGKCLATINPITLSELLVETQLARGFCLFIQSVTLKGFLTGRSVLGRS